MLVLTILAQTLVLAPLAAGFPEFPRQKQLAKIDSQNPADTNTGVVADDGDDSFELIGDLVGLDPAALTPVGASIRNLLLGYDSPESDVEAAFPPLDSPECAQDVCCVWKYVAAEMEDLFRGASGRCTRWARMAVRLGFHDAGTWSKSEGVGGADGSICLTDEISDPENRGLEDMCVQMGDWYDNWHELGHPISMADLIQMGASVATVVCPLGPRIRSFVGRVDDAERNRVSLLPDVFAPAEDLMRLFRDKTISPHALVALVGAHTTSQQRTVDAARGGDPQDSTPGVWDVLFYGETTGASAAPPRVFHLPSDVALSQHSTTSDEWGSFAGSGGQEHWNQDFARAYIRLSMLGVNNINNLTECTKVLPRAVLEFTNPDQDRVELWLNDSMASPGSSLIAETVEEGESISWANFTAA
ncbi:peroxidase [Xylariaceae sp. FL0662B]|nr:peroxidase [Xylariaceae sp. FL0662B]